MRKVIIAILTTMNLLLAFSSLIFSQLAFSQSKPISVTRVKNLEVASLICIDSNGKKTTGCSLDLDGFEVEFYKAFLDSKTAELRIIGRVTHPFSYVEIFLGTKDSIPLREPISRTSYDQENINNNGFFDVSLKIGQTSVLYFYEPRYFVRQFSVSKLLEQR